MKKPKNYYCHRQMFPNQNLPQGYQIIDKIGEGAFGQVYKVFNKHTSTIQVMKCNKADTSSSIMKKQSQIMTELNSSEGFARIKEGTSSNGFLLMTLLGENLENIMQRNSINMIDMKRIAYQCIIRLKQLHERGFVHRDLKPENILLGNQNSPHRIFLVDFGLSNTYRKVSKNARKCYQSQIGTIKYCPLASHQCLEQFPKDDLQSLGYLLVYIFTKKLPWSELPSGLTDEEKFSQIKKAKETVTLENLCQGISCLRKYFKIIKQLQIGSSIDYSSLLDIFFIQSEDSYCYSFCKKDCYAKMKTTIDTKQNSQILDQFTSRHKQISKQRTFMVHK